jgi:hypothetical protein
MVLPAPGSTISLSQVRTELSRSGAISMSGLYSSMAGVPASGGLQLSGHLGGKSNNAIAGRYVRIYNDTTPADGVLHVCQLQVKDYSGNVVSQGKSCYMSSQWDATVPASKAVNGVTWDQGNMAHTARQTNPWIEVDLGGTYTIRQVKIYNRQEFSGRFLGTYCQIKDGGGGVVFTTNMRAKDRQYNVDYYQENGTAGWYYYHTLPVRVGAGWGGSDTDNL